jgi:ribosome maturation factor RimP
MNFNDKNIIRQIAETAAENTGFFLIDFILRGTPRKRVIEVFIDGKENVSAKICAAVSKNISIKLDELLKGNDDYKLIVSSPGIDTPLKYLDQFQKHIGRKLEIVVDDNGDKKKLTAKLLKIVNNDLFVESKNTEQKINFNKIIQAKVILSFS